MKHHRLSLAATALFLTCTSLSLVADVKTDERTRTQFGGALGRIVNFFGGKGAREGMTETVAVKGDRKATFREDSAQIIDLREEQVYDLDVKKKTYKVTTFAELRRQMEEAQKRAEENAKKERGNAPPPQQANVDLQFDVDVKNTGTTKPLNGFNTRQVITTITMHQKGKTIDESGGMVVNMDSWLAPAIPAMKEVAAFDRRYAEKLYGPMAIGASPEQMAAAMAMYPMLKDAIGRVRVEGEKLEGTPIQQTVTIDVVPSAEQRAQQAQQGQQGQEKQSADDGGKTPTSVSGVLGGLARRAARRKAEDNNSDAGNAGAQNQNGRATLMTTSTELLKVAADVADSDVAVPPGFKQTK
jgi:hypothetical protein